MWLWLKAMLRENEQLGQQILDRDMYKDKPESFIEEENKEDQYQLTFYESCMGEVRPDDPYAQMERDTCLCVASHLEALEKKKRGLRQDRS